MSEERGNRPGFFLRLLRGPAEEAIEEAVKPKPEKPAAAKPKPKPGPEPRPAARKAERNEPETRRKEPETRRKEPPSSPVPVAKSEPPQPAPEPAKKTWLARLKTGLSRSSSALGDNIAAVFTQRKLDEEMLQELEDVLISADLGVETAMKIAQAVGRGRYDKEIAPDEVKEVLAAEVEKVLEPVATPLSVDPAHKPYVILIVGVNGTGKTTTIGKLAHSFRNQDRSVMLAAGDTFRAAAIEQLRIWGERTGAPVIARDIGADAAGLVFDAIGAAKEAGTDILMIDTAGRLQNKANLMAELEKVVRVINKQDETAPHDVILVLDATTGQNAVQQVEIFRNVAGVTGLVMTKLDGTARGGILVAIAAKYALPVHAIGIGEGLDDLQPFEARQFARAIAGLAD
ncbi:MAG: signal recognition particle-docking protein FtsY [Hyphomicrobiales bacterium]|nr:signal recognition particle-docking protein FtsY [Hyphomicrobiales bacterium]